MSRIACVSDPKPWAVHILLPILRALAAVLFFVLGPTRVRGRRSIPSQGSVLILANHLADVDPVLVQYACPRHIRFMGKSELFAMKGIGGLMRVLGAYPVKRGEPDRESIRLTVELLKSGETVCVFPEGQLSEHGGLQELKPGVALIVRLANCPVICCGLKRTNRIMPYGSLVPRPAFGGVEANWGAVHHFERDQSNDDIMTWINAELQRLIA